MRAAVAERCPADRRALQRLLTVLAAVALLLTGVVEALPRAVLPPGSVSASAAHDSPVPATSMEAPAVEVVVHGAPLAVVPAPTGPATGLLPLAGPLVAAHLVARPQTRPPTPRLPAGVPGTHGSRAPPSTTGT